MLESKNIYILGYSGHAYVIVESALSSEHTIKGYFDSKPNDENPHSLVYFGDENKVNFKELVGNDYVFPAIGNNNLRKKMLDLMQRYKSNQLCIIDNGAKVSKTATIDVSTFVSSGAIINSMAKVGKGCIINTRAVVEHQCNVGDYSHIAPGVTLLGNVQVGSYTFIGANSVVKEGISVGDHVIVGAGSVVIRDLPSGTKWVGNPAKNIR